YVEQIIAFVDGQVTLGYGAFGRTPRPEDAAGLTLDADDLNDLRACRPSKCGVRLGTVGTAQAEHLVDWNAADAGTRATALAGQGLADYAADYVKRGNAALVTYDDKERPVSLDATLRGIVANSPALKTFAPAVQRFLLDYPAATLPGGRDFVYWDKQKLTG